MCKISSRGADHPRTCGEKNFLRFGCKNIQGSPPHMRGKVFASVKHICGGGITPAHAGKSNKIASECTPMQDHPRTCGEKYTKKKKKADENGSPPHMRGKGRRIKKMFPKVRITPAHAGKSNKIASECTPMQDHPRTCGEKGLAVKVCSPRKGSPPHMRGKAFAKLSAKQKTGITPAHAGKSPQDKRCNHTYRDHPRTCGEKYTKYLTEWEYQGSPPHMRGKVFPVTEFSKS